ncbi:hypothetical protein L2104_13060 [Citrobacter braakii]|uniref:glycine-rich domain-containing protein n=1 Tax=Citrobacter braakii TaxID=57706 RepID=UPI0023B22B30|nr:hypothetical protein [Citrobacter braakii]MDE9659453.1 hypothetical protein [Citrobacter braakii]
MYHVDNSTGVPVMPNPSPVTSKTVLFFTEGGNGVPPTYPGPDWFNAIQSELLNILRAAGLDPDKMDNTQILAALKKLFLSRSNPFGDIKADGEAAIATALANLGLADSDGVVGRLFGKPKIFISSGIYTPTPGAKFADVQVLGAGGGGGNATGRSTISSAGSSAGGGSYSLSRIKITTGTAVIAVGAGGVPSGDGGTSSFSGFGETITAYGGGAGLNDIIYGSLSNSRHARGSSGGRSTGGNIINNEGGAASPSLLVEGVPSGGVSGSSQLSGGVTGAGAAGGAGKNGTLGAGGSGATVYMSEVTNIGGYGGNGIVIIQEYA